jgi:hypothetical protein
MLKAIPNTPPINALMASVSSQLLCLLSGTSKSRRTLRRIRNGYGSNFVPADKTQEGVRPTPEEKLPAFAISDPCYLAYRPVRGEPISAQTGPNSLDAGGRPRICHPYITRSDLCRFVCGKVFVFKVPRRYELQDGVPKKKWIFAIVKSPCHLLQVGP